MKKGITVTQTETGIRIDIPDEAIECVIPMSKKKGKKGTPYQTPDEISAAEEEAPVEEPTPESESEEEAPVETEGSTDEDYVIIENENGVNVERKGVHLIKVETREDAENWIAHRK